MKFFRSKIYQDVEVFVFMVLFLSVICLFTLQRGIPRVTPPTPNSTQNDVLITEAPVVIVPKDRYPGEVLKNNLLVNIQDVGCLFVVYDFDSNVFFKSCTEPLGLLYKSYVIDRNILYFTGGNQGLTRVTQIGGTSTLRAIHLSADSAYIALDGDVFLNSYKIPGADADSFSVVGFNEFLPGPDSPPGFQTISYARDKTHAYYDGVQISGADAGTFQFIPTGAYAQNFARDKSHVYYRGGVIPSADPETFKPLEMQAYEGRGLGPYGIDRTHVFYGAMLVEGADVNSFKLVRGVDGDYATDKEHVFLDGKIIPGANPQTFDFPVYEYG